MRRTTTRGFLRGTILLSLSAGRVGCFAVCGAGRPRSTAYHLRPPSSSSSRRVELSVQQTQQPHSGRAIDSAVGVGGEKGLIQRTRSGRKACFRQGKGIRLFAAAGKITEEEIERNYTPEEREFVENFLSEYEAAEEPQPDDDDLAVYSNDYKMYAEGGPESLNIEWDAAMGKVDFWDLPPYEDFDPKKKEAIEPMMSVIEQVCTLIDTTDDVFSFKYVGPIRHKKGIASWAMVLIKQLYPEVKGVEFVTNRTRDRKDW